MNTEYQIVIDKTNLQDQAILKKRLMALNPINLSYFPRTISIYLEMVTENYIFLNLPLDVYMDYGDRLVHMLWV